MSAPGRWVCYLLSAADGSQRTYVGATVDPDRRLRQHNREITGGARATAGRHWTRICYVTGFADNHAALQFEWRWKYYGRKYDRSGGTAVERRIRSLRRLLADKKWAGAGLEIVWSGVAAAADPVIEIAENGNIWGTPIAHGAAQPTDTATTTLSQPMILTAEEAAAAAPAAASQQGR